MRKYQREMFKCNIRQKMLSHHKGEDYPSNLIVYFIKCIELASKTESPIENLRSIGLIFYSNCFIINIKVLSNVLMIPSAYIKKLLTHHQCSLIHDMKPLPQIREVHDNKKWSFYTYGNTNDANHLFNILSKLNFLIDGRRNNTLNEDQKIDFGLVPFSIPNALPNLQTQNPNYLDKQSKFFISDESIHQIDPKSSTELALIQLNTTTFWPFHNVKCKKVIANS